MGALIRDDDVPSADFYYLVLDWEEHVLAKTALLRDARRIALDVDADAIVRVWPERPIAGFTIEHTKLDRVYWEPPRLGRDYGADDTSPFTNTNTPSERNTTP